jgi:EF-P beta-lysylation protein EpmB
VPKLPVPSNIHELPSVDINCVEALTWQEQLADIIRDPKELIDLLGLSQQQLPAALLASDCFSLRVPRAYAKRIEYSNINDPLLRQVLPLGDELLAVPGYNSDPLGEAATNSMPGLIHKYKGRVLLLVSTSCAINCRYCFRREFPYSDNKPNRVDWQRVFDYIAADESINEVILSGGDPLTAPDNQLAWLVEQAAGIPHIRRLRIHTRLPVVVPSRIDERCLAWLTNHRLQTVVVIHSNHANEIDDEVRAALSRLTAAGITLLNQAVLLKGVNDSVAALSELSETLFASGVLPYYLHLLDKVSGAAHFEVPEPEARALYQSLLAELPGFLVPTLVREIAGESSKTPIL